MKSLIEYIKSKKVLEFLNAKGFYIVLLLCVVTITMTAYIVTKRNLSTYLDDAKFDELTQQLESDGKDLSANTTNNNNNNTKNESKVEEKPLIQATNNNQAPVPKHNPTKKNNSNISKLIQVPDKKTFENTTTLKSANEKIDMDNPVEGNIINSFSPDNLIYSKTLDQWTTHEGVDIAAERGTPVKCAADGIVEDVYTDPMEGITIIINHGNNIKTKYCNLSTDSMITKGKNVKKDDVISGVGNTAIFELSDISHLHFEVIKDGKNVNPNDYLK